MKKEEERLIKHMIFNMVQSNDRNAYVNEIVVDMNILQKNKSIVMF